MKIVKVISFVCFAAAIFWACEDNSPDTFGRKSYDSSKPVRINGFEPDSGGLATKVFISGSNFGSDLSRIRVWFTAYTDEGTQVNVRASVVGSSGDHMYVITPRLSHLRECTISVVSHGDSTSFADKQFLYHTTTTVTTITGRKGTDIFSGGTLAEATFHFPQQMCVDDENNIFVGHYTTIGDNNGTQGMILINVEKDIVQQVSNAMNPYQPTVGVDGTIWVVPGAGYAVQFLDPLLQWQPKNALILRPTLEQQIHGMRDFTIGWKYGLATSVFDNGFVYTHSSATGDLIKYDPATRVGQKVAEHGMGWQSRLCFDPYRPHILYLLYHVGVIYTYDLIEERFERFAGTGVFGYRDGPRLEAQFNLPRQIIVDTDGALIIADTNNHCIRRIGQDGMVSTLIGKGQQPGYQDGNPADALFQTPEGIAIGKDGTIYVSDSGNNVIRKLAVE